MGVPYQYAEEVVAGDAMIFDTFHNQSSANRAVAQL
jgi:hypothetical protein